jgi:hypothetical protein
MPFVAEDGTGYANANSLSSVEFADNYHAERGNAAWAAFDLERKQQLLIKATDYVTGVYNVAFEGRRAVAGQGLPFPRIVNYANVGNPIGVQQAISELALVAHTTPLSANISRGKKRVKIGPLEVEYDGNSPTQTMFVSASLRLAPFLKAGSTNGFNIRLTRA